MTQFNRSDERSAERIEFARDQRRTANEFANDVWQMIRAGRVLGLKFRREHPIGPYTVDFVCLSIWLVIEVDGKDHFTEEGRARDQRRDEYLREQGFEVVRFEGYRVTREPREVRREIEVLAKQRRAEINAAAPLPQPLSPKRGEGSQNERSGSKPILFTIGHSNRSPEEFVAVLKENGVTAIADVRSQPYSRYMPHFNRGPLQALLKENAIAYVFLGEELGARRGEDSCYVDGQAKYDLIAKTDAFQAGIDRLLDGTKKYVVALMCAEKDPITCHRTILVAKSLRHEFEIRHIIAPQTVETHAKAEKRLLACFQLDKEDLFRSQEERLRQAYALQSCRIAYRSPSNSASVASRSGKE